jgi:predicted nucleotidyltransferase
MARLKLDRLPKPELISDPVAEVLERIAEYPEVRFILIFGSRAIGDADDRSDVDVSISPPSMSRGRWLEIQRLAEEAPTLLRISLIRFDSSPAQLQRSNLADGVIVYESEKAATEPR